MLFWRGMAVCTQSMPPPRVTDVWSFFLPAFCYPEEVFQFADGQGRGGDQGSDNEEKFLGLLHDFLNPQVRLVVMKRLYSPLFWLA